MILLITDIVLRGGDAYDGVLAIDLPELRGRSAGYPYNSLPDISGSIISSISQLLPNYDPFTVYGYDSCKITEVNI